MIKAFFDRLLAKPSAATPTDREAQPPSANRERLRVLVDALGGCRHSRRVGDQWVDLLGLSLAAWRAPDGRLSTERRRCELVLAKGQHLDAIPPYAIVDVELAGESDASCRLPPDELFQRADPTWLTRIVAVDVADPELEAMRTALKTPVRIRHPQLGDFEYDRSIRSFGGGIDWDGRRVALHLTCTDPAQPEAVLAHADALLARWAQWQQRAPAFAAERLLSLKNEAWSEEDDDGEELPPLTHAQFVARLSPNSIGIDEGGSVSFWFDDGDLFFGHAIHVNGNVDGTLDDAGIAG